MRIANTFRLLFGQTVYPGYALIRDIQTGILGAIGLLIIIITTVTRPYLHARKQRQQRKQTKAPPSE